MPKPITDKFMLLREDKAGAKGYKAHLSSDGAVTLCGVPIPGRKWIKENDTTIAGFCDNVANRCGACLRIARDSYDAGKLVNMFS